VVQDWREWPGDHYIYMGEIVHAYKLKKNDIYVFNFFDCPDYGLSLSVLTGKY
jgi:hypothetical protein